MSPSLVVRTITHEHGVRDWLAVPHRVFANDRHWIAPLHIHERERITPGRNPFFTFGEAKFFVAYRDGTPIGRISAQVNRRYIEHHRDRTGHFGFFDCTRDTEAAVALIDAAADWLRSQGTMRMQGPFSLTINEHAGLLISGHDSPPAILSSHAPAWAGGLLEYGGLTKVVDLHAYRMIPKHLPDKIERLAGFARKSHRIRLRHFDMKDYEREVALVFDIFNDAWSDNWGFVPVGPEEIEHLAKETKALMQTRFGRIVEIDGSPAAVMVILPDINRVIAPFNGRLLPFNWAKLSYAIWRDRWKTARIPLLGIRRAYRNTTLSAGVLSLLVAELLELAQSYDLEWIEFSWVLETNRPMVAISELAAGKPSKTYRIYQRQL